MILKRVFDVIIALLGLAILWPILLIIGTAVYLSSPGPIFYRGIRAGKDGQPFKIFKFRTMILNAEKIGGGTTTLNDERIIPVGAFLRRYKLDELPQLINVLKGDMSIVGPRPELLKYTKSYDNQEKVILSIKPGITDYSSIEFASLDEIVGYQNADEIYEKEVLRKKNALRIKYVKERNMMLDLIIIMKTFVQLMRKL